MSSSRAASWGASGPAAAKSTATRWPASSTSATSPVCSRTRLVGSSGNRRVWTGSALDTCSNYRPPEQQANYANHAGQAHKCATLEARRVEVDLHVVFARAKCHAAIQAVGVQHGDLGAVDPGTPAWIPRFALE